MSVIGEVPTDVKYRVPAEHGGLFSFPSLRAAGTLIVRNQERFDETQVASALPEFGGESLSELRAAARQELGSVVAAYAREYLNFEQSGAISTAGPLILTGHQPELFHPGVWVKNFAASMLAEQHEGTAINILVDNDVVGHPSILVPRLEKRDQPKLVNCSIDADSPPRPYEQRDVLDRILFDSFADRVRELIRPLVPEPLVTEIWPEAVASAARQGNLGRALAQARHLLERRSGLSHWEVPLSALCETHSFRHFVASILIDVHRFIEVYNASILSFRKRHRLRSRSHPAPLLTINQPAVETPFWVWRHTDPRREPLVMRYYGPESAELSHGWHGEVIGRVPLGSARDLASALGELAANGVRVRPRALLTTLYLRLMCGDLFIHGIGGGKYDQVTDAIILDFVHVPPPEYLVMSATFRLPFGVLPVQADDLRQVDGMLREIHYHPENFDEQVNAGDRDEFRRLAAQKGQWLQRRPSAGSARDWQARLEQINQGMREKLDSGVRQLKAERDQMTKLYRAGRIILSREYSFCLFSANDLRRELRGLVEKN